MIAPHRLAVLAHQADCALECGRGYVEVHAVDLQQLVEHAQLLQSCAAASAVAAIAEADREPAS